MKFEHVSAEEIAWQRANGWPDFHPEDFCHRCGRPNAGSWSAPSDLWNAAKVEASVGSGIVCPSCFALLYEQATGEATGWWFTRRIDRRPLPGREQ